MGSVDDSSASEEKFRRPNFGFSLSTFVVGTESTDADDDDDDEPPAELVKPVKPDSCLGFEVKIGLSDSVAISYDGGELVSESDPESDAISADFESRSVDNG